MNKWILQLRFRGNPVYRKQITGTILDAKVQAENIAWWMNGVLGEAVATVGIQNEKDIEVAEIGHRPIDKEQLLAMSAKSPGELAAEIAKRHLGMVTLDTRDNDELDFHDLAVWNIKAALIEALQAGARTGAPRP